MVVKMMKWRPWPPLSSKKVGVKITIRGLKGMPMSSQVQDSARFAVEVKWKGSKGIALGTLRRSVRRNFTKEESLREDGVVAWDEEFQNVCNFSAYKGGVFLPWEVSFALFNGLKQGPNNKVSVVAKAYLNIADFASETAKQGREISLPLAVPGGSNDNTPLLCLSVVLLEMGTVEEPPEVVLRPIVSFPLSPCYGEVLSTEKNDLSAFKASLKRVNIFKGLSTRRAKKGDHEDGSSDGRTSVRSEDVDLNSPLDTDSLDELDEGESEEGSSGLRKSFSYGTLAYANHAGATHSNTSSSEDEDWVYYSHHRSDAGRSYLGDSNGSVPDQTSQQSSRRGILRWRKRKLNFRSPKNKGEPLLKKYYGDEGGDDIDFDRRQLNSSVTFRQQSSKASGADQTLVSEFGDDNFAVGSWEQKEIISRDGHLKMQAQVFFASIDQRNERAAGESACTALVAVIADWFHSNPEEMPIKSQLDSMIREGSLEWRNLCENETYRERFPDKHFDLETILEGKVRPLSVIPEKSFIGFFHPEGLEDGGFDFLQGAMSFDHIWNEISQSSLNSDSTSEPFIYIISWNDHFFVLKVEQHAYYIIDTLGERLYEGCNQAFILKFDRDTTIHEVPKEAQESDDKPESLKEEENEANNTAAENINSNADGDNEAEEPRLVCRGKESCKDYIKSFLAAIPIRELQDDLKKGLMASKPLHQRLQIEFHYTKSLQVIVEPQCAYEARADIAAILPNCGMVTTNVS